MENGVTNWTKHYPHSFYRVNLDPCVYCSCVCYASKRNLEEVCLLFCHYNLTWTLPPVPCEGLCNAQLWYKCSLGLTNSEKNNYVLMETWLSQFSKPLKAELLQLTKDWFFFFFFFPFCSSHKLCLRKISQWIHWELIHKLAPEKTARFTLKWPTETNYLYTQKILCGLVYIILNVYIYIYTY